MAAQRSLEELFVEFRRTGTPAALAELFDRAAPELLHVACHIARDLASAEDLVQQTFLTALEAAPRYDARRRVLPWLLGILAHHARNERRRGARHDGPAVGELRHLPGGEPAAPGRDIVATAGLRELDGVVQRELERLTEPYREVALRALRHGEKPAAIALALGRSPGTVRVQLHRALELLRQRLPRGAALGGLFAPSLAAELGRGLLAVRLEVVLGAKAAALLVTVGAGAWWLSRWWTAVPEPIDGVGVATRPVEADAVAAAAEATKVPPVAAPAAERISAEAATRPGLETAAVIVGTLTGEVVDAEQLQPVAGATIEFFAPLSLTLEEVARRFGDYSSAKVQLVGQLHFGTGWPRVVEPLPPNSWPDRAPVELCAPPDEIGVALTRTVAGVDGRFALPLPRAVGVVVVSHSDFERQVVALPLEGATESAAAKAEGAGDAVDLSIALERLRDVEGFLVDEKDAPVRECVRLRLSANPQGRTPNDVPSEFESRRGRRAGPWLVDTDEGGTFTASIGSACVVVECVTPGFAMVERQELRGGLIWHGSAQLRPGSEDAPAKLVVRRMPVLTVLDARSGAPIESLSLLATSMESGYVSYHGRVRAPAGLIELESGARPTSYMNSRQDPLRIALWTPRHDPCEIEIPPSDRRVDMTVELEPGAPLQLDGTVVRDGVPIVGATVTLNGYYPLSWRQDDLERIDEEVSDAAGAFALQGPPGKFIVRVVASGALPLVRMVELPAAGPLHVDFAAGGTIDVVVLDPAGTPRRDAKVYIRSPSERSQEGYSDESGAVRFEGLDPGEYAVSLHGTRELHVPIPQALEKVAVVDRATVAVALTAPPAGPIHLRIVAAGTGDFTGWRARDGIYLVSEWHDLDASGRIDADAVNWTDLEVASPSGFRWRLPLPLVTLVSGVVELPVGDVGYRGRVVDRVTGAPLAGAIVRASPPGGESFLRAVADADGRFVLLNLEPVVHSLQVQRDPNSVDPDSPGWFTPSQPAAPGGREVVLRVPEVRGDRVSGTERRVYRGRVTRRSDGAPLANARLMLTARFVDDDGEWRVAVDGAHARSGADGRYQLVVARAVQYQLWANRDDATDSVSALRETWRDGGGADEVETRDIAMD